MDEADHTRRVARVKSRDRWKTTHLSGMKLPAMPYQVVTVDFDSRELSQRYSGSIAVEAFEHASHFKQLLCESFAAAVPNLG